MVEVTTTTIAVSDLVRLLDQIVETRAAAIRLKVALAELIEGPFALVHDLSVFDEAKAALESASKVLDAP